MLSTVIKPWGKEEILSRCENKYLVKKLTLNQGHRTSLHFHEKKQETLLLVSGKMKVSMDGLSFIISSNEYFTIAPLVVHRMEALETCVYIECSTDNNVDVVRLSDDYKRNGE